MCYISLFFVAELKVKSEKSSLQASKKNVQEFKDLTNSGVALQTAKGNAQVGGDNTQFGGIQSKFHSASHVC